MPRPLLAVDREAVAVHSARGTPGATHNDSAALRAAKMLGTSQIFQPILGILLLHHRALGRLRYVECETHVPTTSPSRRWHCRAAVAVAIRESALMETWIVLTDDWELRGNGTGRVEDLQEKPALRLMDLYDKVGIKSTFNIEVLQQLAFEKYAVANESIRAGRDAWRQMVCTMVARGFDVQLHLHPQWMNAELINGWWKLGRRWNIADYTQPEIANMMDAALSYLAPLIAPRKVQSFRGGSWGMGPPSRIVLNELSVRGVRLDVSIVKGNYYFGEAIKLDYRRLDCPFLPYRPDIDDIRRLPRSPQHAAPIVEVPTQSVERWLLARRLLSKAIRNRSPEPLRGAFDLVRGTPSYARLAKIASVARNAMGWSNPAKLEPDFVIRDPFGFLSGRAKSDVIFDLSSEYPAVVFREMADICIARARNSKRPLTVLVFENHTKDLQHANDFARIENLITHIRSNHPHVAFKSIAQVAERLDQVVC